MSFLINLYETIARMLFWGWKLRHNKDYDGQFMYEVISFKLERMQRCMTKYGHCEWNSSPDTPLMKRLAEAKVLAKRLSQSNGDTYVMEHMERFSRPEKSDLVRRFNLFPDAKVLPEKLYRVYFKKALERDKMEHAEQKKRLYYLLNKYLEQWWD